MGSFRENQQEHLDLIQGSSPSCCGLLCSARIALATTCLSPGMCLSPISGCSIPGCSPCLEHARQLPSLGNGGSPSWKSAHPWMETTRAPLLCSNELREALSHPSFHKAGVPFGGIQFPLPSRSSACNFGLLGLNPKFGFKPLNCGDVGKHKYLDHCRAEG